MTTATRSAPRARRLCIGGVALVRGAVKGGPAMVEVAREIEPLLAASSWFPAAPFRYVSLVIRYGEGTDLRTEFAPIKKHNGALRSGELPIATQISMDKARACARDHGHLVSLFRYVTLLALHAVAAHYKLDASFLPSPIEPENA